MGLAVKTAEYYARRNPHIDIEDLIQEGRIGIIVALGKFDVDKGYRFSTYASWWIKHYVQRYVVAGHSRAASTSKKDTEAYLGERMTEEDAKLYEVRCISYVGLQSSDDKDWDHLEDFLCTDSVAIEDAVEVSIDWQNVVACLLDESISERDRTIMCMRYGVLGYSRRNLSEIADEFSLTRQAVGLIERRCTKKLRAMLEESGNGR